MSCPCTRLSRSLRAPAALIAEHLLEHLGVGPGLVDLVARGLDTLGGADAVTLGESVLLLDVVVRLLLNVNGRRPPRIDLVRVDV